MNATTMNKTEDALFKHLSNFLDEFECQFDLENNLDFTSPEFAEDYIEAATYAKSLGRKATRIEEVRAILDERDFDQWDGGYEGDGKFADNH